MMRQGRGRAHMPSGASREGLDLPSSSPSEAEAAAEEEALLLPEPAERAAAAAAGSGCCGGLALQAEQKSSSV